MMQHLADPPKPGDWIKAESDDRWLLGGVYWVSIRCLDDGTDGVGVMAGDSAKPIAILNGMNVNDGRDYVVTHYCPCLVNWPQPAEEGR